MLLAVEAVTHCSPGRTRVRQHAIAPGQHCGEIIGSQRCAVQEPLRELIDILCAHRRVGVHMLYAGGMCEAQRVASPSGSSDAGIVPPS